MATSATLLLEPYKLWRRRRQFL